MTEVGKRIQKQGMICWLQICTLSQGAPNLHGLKYVLLSVCSAQLLGLILYAWAPLSGYHV